MRMMVQLISSRGKNRIVVQSLRVSNSNPDITIDSCVILSKLFKHFMPWLPHMGIILSSQVCINDENI